jgi:hypothetical protein
MKLGTTHNSKDNGGHSTNPTVIAVDIEVGQVLSE